MEYTVIFTQNWDYYVEAQTVNEAIEIAREEFEDDMRDPIACTYYDYVITDPDYDDVELEE